MKVHYLLRPPPCRYFVVVIFVIVAFIIGIVVVLVAVVEGLVTIKRFSQKGVVKRPGYEAIKEMDAIVTVVGGGGESW